MHIDKLKNITSLLFIALGLLLIGYILNNWFPINKAIWSSSFVLVTTGWATLILAIIYYLIDIKGLFSGTLFKYVGMNAITIYFLSSFISKSMYLIKVGPSSNVHAYLYETLFNYDFISNKLSSLLYALVVVGIYLMLSYFLYKKKLFIKV